MINTDLRAWTCSLKQAKGIQKAKDYVEIGVDAEEYYRIKDSEKEADEK